MLGRKSEILREAASITLALDKGKYKRVVRFRCDTPMPVVDGEPAVAKGVLGIVDCSHASAADFEEDHAIKAMRKVDGLITTFFAHLWARGGQPLAPDLCLKEHILKNVRALAADGASEERRALARAAKLIFRNRKLLIRDPAHAIRIAVKNSLHADACFDEVWSEIFDKRHALAPDIMHSDKWRDLLTNVQKDTSVTAVAVPGVGDQQPLALVFKCLAFAKQRFDSSAGPVAKMALMLVPIAVLLAYIDSDMRHAKDKRDRALALLKRLNAKFCLSLGLSADWGITTQAFLRLFDQADHDISESVAHIEALIDTLTTLFINGRIFMRASAGSAAAGATDIPGLGDALKEVGVRPHFVTHYVERQLAKRFVIYCGGRPVMPWRPVEGPVVVELSQRLQNSATLAVQRLRAGFPSTDVRAHMSIFDCKRSVPFMSRPTGDPGKKKVLEHVRLLATEYGLDAGVTQAILEYRDVAGTVLGLIRRGKPLAAASNACVWSFVVSPGFICEGRVAPLRFLPKLARWYISIEDGECSVERDLAVVRAVSDTTRTDDVGIIDDTVVGRFGAPASRSEVEDPATGGLTNTSRAWARYWRTCHGARLGCVSNKSIASALAALKKKPTWQKFRKGILAAAAGAVSTEKQIGAASAATATCFGVPVGPLRRTETSVTGTPECDYWTKKCANFAKVTENKKTQGNFLLRYKFQINRGAARPRKLQGVTRVCWLEPPAEDCPQAAFLGTERGANKCRHAELVITDEVNKLSDGQTLSANKQLVVDLIYIIALGKPVVTANAWRMAGGRPNDVAASDILRHVALATGERQPVCNFSYTRNFRYWHTDVVGALTKIAKLPRSRWRVVESATGCGTLSQLVEQLLEKRLVENTLGKKWCAAR